MKQLNNEKMIIIILGSKSDMDWGKQISKEISRFGVEYKINIASAHKTPVYLLSLLNKYEKQNTPLVYICVAGRSNALGGFTDANVLNPVINCPPPSDKFAGLDILSSLRMPSGVACMTVLEPDQAAIAAVKILSFNNRRLKQKITDFQNKMRKKVKEND